jgi:hypothetical protein
MLSVVGALMLLVGAAAAVYVGPHDEVELRKHLVGPVEAP